MVRTNENKSKDIPFKIMIKVSEWKDRYGKTQGQWRQYGMLYIKADSVPEGVDLRNLRMNITLEDIPLKAIVPGKGIYFNVCSLKNDKNGDNPFTQE